MKIKQSKTREAFGATGIEDLSDSDMCKEVYTTDERGLGFEITVTVGYVEGKRPVDICQRAMRLVRDVETKDQLSLDGLDITAKKKRRGKIEGAVDEGAVVQ